MSDPSPRELEERIQLLEERLLLNIGRLNRLDAQQTAIESEMDDLDAKLKGVAQERDVRDAVIKIGEHIGKHMRLWF